MLASIIFRVNKIAVRVCNWNVDIALFGWNMLHSKILRVYMKRDSKVLCLYKIPVRVSTFYANVT